MTDPIHELRFDTERLAVDEWHRVAEHADLGLATFVAQLMNPRTTQSLPPSWRGIYSVDRARAWIAERDAESPTCLVTDRRTGEAIGLLIIFVELGTGEASQTDVRLGYILMEARWGEGIASELVAGLVQWARSRDDIATLTA